MKAFYLSLVVITALALNACGFHARDTQALSSSVSPMLITGIGEYSDLLRSMRFSLRSSGVDVTTSREEANTILHIQDHGVDSQLLTVDDRGKGVEYMLTHLATIRLTHSSGKSLVENKKVGVRRVWFSSGETGLAGQRKRQEIEKGMVHDDLPQAIIRSVGASLQAAKGSGTN